MWLTLAATVLLLLLGTYNNGRVKGLVGDDCESSPCVATIETCVSNACTCTSGHESVSGDNSCTPWIRSS